MSISAQKNWTVHKTGACVDHPVNDVFEILDEHGYTVAMLEERDEDHYAPEHKAPTLEEIEHLAQLIATTPELLEMLSAVANQMCQGKKYHDWSYDIHIPAEMAECIQATIAKATS